MNVLDLFSGIGGFSLGLERAGMKTVAFCEIEPFCQKVLKKHWPDVPIFEDIKELHAESIGETIDVVAGGFPCQPFSVAGEQCGEDDDRHLWPEMFRIIQETRPRWVVGENVTGIINMALDQVLFNLENEKYTSQTFIVPACGVDAPHRRERVWIVSHSNSKSKSSISINAKKRKRFPSDTNSDRRSQVEQHDGRGEKREGAVYSPGKRPVNGRKQSRWPAEPGICRVVDGIPYRVDRLKGLGNAVVPQIPEIIGRAIMEIEGLT